MRNPYEDEQDLTDYRVSRRHALVFSALFLAALSLPPLADALGKTFRGKLAESPMVRLLASRPSADSTLRDHIAGVERSLDQLGYAQSMRRWTQQAFTAWAAEGNRKVEIGRNGWLFYRP